MSGAGASWRSPASQVVPLEAPFKAENMELLLAMGFAFAADSLFSVVEFRACSPNG